MKYIMAVSASVLALTLSVSALAKDEKDNSGYQTMDMKQFDSINAKPGKVGTGVNFNITCLADDGRVLKPDHAEFSTCMMKKKNQIGK